MIVRFCQRWNLLTSSCSLRRNALLQFNRADSTWNRVKDFVLAAEKENFHVDFIRRAHKWDGVCTAEWKLVYRDIGASRTFFLTSTLLPIGIVGAVVMVCDFIAHKDTDRMDIVQKILKDVEELGTLIALPIVMGCIVIALLLRVQQIRLLRIYQNINNVDRYLAVGSRTVVGQRQIHFGREESCAVYYDNYSNEVAQVLLHFLLGNVQIGRRRFMVMDDSFLANNFRSYMLNETSVPPRMTS